MLIPIINIALGLILVIGGATGKLGLAGSSNQTIPIVVGAAVAIYGVIQAVRAARRR